MGWLSRHVEACLAAVIATLLLASAVAIAVRVRSPSTAHHRSSTAPADTTTTTPVPTTVPPAVSDPGQLGMYLVDADTGAIRPVLLNYSFENVSFSPDGRQLVFAGRVGGGGGGEAVGVGGAAIRYAVVESAAEDVAAVATVAAVPLVAVGIALVVIGLLC